MYEIETRYGLELGRDWVEWMVNRQLSLKWSRQTRNERDALRFAYMNDCVSSATCQTQLLNRLQDRGLLECFDQQPAYIKNRMYYYYKLTSAGVALVEWSAKDTDNG